MLLDTQRIDSLYSGEDEEDKKWFQDMLGTLLENMETRLVNIQKCIDEGNDAQLQKELHQIKGMSLNFGLAELSKHSQEAEAFVKNAETDKAIPIANGLRDLWDKTRKELLEYTGKA